MTEPVAYHYYCADDNKPVLTHDKKDWAERRIHWKEVPLVPQRPWVGLTPKEVADIVVYPMNPTADVVKAIEAKLKEKNDR